jgi:hypothetical protein
MRFAASEMRTPSCQLARSHLHACTTRMRAPLGCLHRLHACTACMPAASSHPQPNPSGK